MQALGLTGQKLLGVPIIVQHTQAEKNRVGNTLPNLAPKTSNGPTRLYVGSLHFNITEDMLRGIFEPFGKIDHIQLMTDPETGKSKGYGFLTVSVTLKTPILTIPNILILTAIITLITLLFFSSIMQQMLKKLWNN